MVNPFSKWQTQKTQISWIWLLRLFHQGHSKFPPKNDEKNLIGLHFKIGKNGFPSFLTYSQHTLGVGQHVGMFAKTPPVSLFQQYVNNIGESSSCHPRKYKTSAILENKRPSSLDNTHQESFIKSIRYHLNRDPDRALCKIIIGRPSGVGILLTNLKRILCSKICESRWEVSQHCFQNQKIKQMFTFPPFWFWHFLPERRWGVLNNLKLGKPPLSDYNDGNLDVKNVGFSVNWKSSVQPPSLPCPL